MSIKNYTDEELKKELIHRKMKRILDKPKVKKDIDFTPLIKLCESIINQIEEHEVDDDDNAQYAYETTMSCIYGNNVWDWINSIIR